MTLKNSTALNQRLIEKIARSFSNNNENFELFFNGCVLDTLKITLEAGSQTMTDDGFTKKDLKTMRSTKLEQIKFSDNPEDDSKFRINTGDNESDYILCSNRDSVNKEVRGKILKNALNTLKEKQPNMALYDALDMLNKNPYAIASYLYTPISSGAIESPDPDLLSDPDEKSLFAPETSEIFIGALTGLAKMYITRVKKYRRTYKKYGTNEKINEEIDKKIGDAIIAEMSSNIDNLLTLFVRAEESNNIEDLLTLFVRAEESNNIEDLLTLFVHAEESKNTAILITSLSYIDEIKNKHKKDKKVMKAATAAEKLLKAQISGGSETEIQKSTKKFEAAIENISVKKFVGLTKLLKNLVNSLKSIKKPPISFSRLPAWIRKHAYEEDNEHKKVKQELKDNFKQNTDGASESNNTPAPTV